MGKYQDFSNLQGQIDQLVQGHPDELVQEMFEFVASKHSDFKIVSITGYTPSFNDGDPCTFTTNVEFGDALDIAYELSEEDREEIAELFGVESFDDVDISVNFGWERADEIREDIDTELLRQINGEDGWLVIAVVDPTGKIHVYNSEYDCGY